LLFDRPDLPPRRDPNCGSGLSEVPLATSLPSMMIVYWPYPGFLAPKSQTPVPVKEKVAEAARAFVAW
jgi:hypothetical protein